ncbi:MAG: pseudouridine synthase, partial [Proteobacteria bacterium]|nr:pseudouridine synthase [Pseudomonadota bacterium]
PLKADPDHRPRHRVDATGKDSITHFEVLQATPQSSRVRLKPVTGRSHQLRVHLSHLGYPILGCDLYAHDAAFKAAPRLMLHAQELSFKHPATGSIVNFKDSPPF